MDEQDVFKRLFDAIERRGNTLPTTSYVAGLTAGDVGRINAKVLDEADEVCLVTGQGDLEHWVCELADLLFHTFVLAVCQGISLERTRGELERRFGTSGLAEKARRTSRGDAR